MNSCLYTPFLSQSLLPLDLGLDPAGPGFDSTKNGLNKTCAKFVQVLHTNPGELGTNEQRGDLNFYANNKTNLQPGCAYSKCGECRVIFF